MMANPAKNQESFDNQKRAQKGGKKTRQGKEIRVAMVPQGFLQNGIDARIESMAYFVANHGCDNKQFRVMRSAFGEINS